MVIPLFKSHYSLGRSILTLSSENDLDEEGPDSIIDICKDNNLKEMLLVEDSMTGFFQAYVNSKEENLKLIFGLRLSICSDMYEKSEDSFDSLSKYVIFCRNTQAYKDLIKIHDLAAKEGFYYYPRIDFKNLKKLWTKNLKLCVPFYDSFIYNNILLGKSCIPEFDFADPVTFFTEDNGLPFDNLLLDGVMSFLQNGKQETIKAKSIFYKNKKDFKSYLTFRCINNRSTLDKPNLDHMTSDEFSFESWKESK
tara:strand:- start:300 stop:1055 length:756 start_codon:yes stop_codon:yes gene_type:complete